MQEKIFKAFIFALLATAIGLPFSFLAFGSDSTINQGKLYPYRSMIQIQDDFICGINTNGTTGCQNWIINGGSSAGVTSVAGRPGLFQKNTSAVSGTIAQLVLGGTAGNIDVAVNNRITFASRLNNNDANTTVRIGDANAFSVSPPGSGNYFEKLDADTNWFCVTRSGGVETRTDTGVAVSTNFVTMTTNRNSTGVQFILDYVLVCTHTTNISTGLSNPGLHIVNSAAAAKTIDVDYFELTTSGLAR